LGGQIFFARFAGEFTILYTPPIMELVAPPLPMTMMEAALPRDGILTDGGKIHQSSVDWLNNYSANY